MKTKTHTFTPVALGDTDNVNHLVVGNHIGDEDRLLKVLPSPVNFLRDGPAVHLNLHDVGLLLALLQQFLLQGENESVKVNKKRKKCSSKTDQSINRSTDAIQSAKYKTFLPSIWLYPFEQ